MDGTPTDLMREYYAQRASAGLIITEGTTPSRVGQSYPNIPGLYTDAHVRGWRKVTDAVKARGGRMFVQIQHAGRAGHPDNSGLTPQAPSPIALPETIHTPSGRQESVVPEEMTAEDIRDTVADFAATARRAVEAGFEGVEVHSANGHLLHQFIAENTNHRTDSYGGSLENRLRLTVEVVEAVAAEIGPERVGLRISPGNTVNGIAEGETGEIYPALADRLAGSGIAYLHVIFAEPESELFRTLRAKWPTAIIANPSLGETVPEDGGAEAGRKLLEAGADFIALGRAFIANPDLVERLEKGAPLNGLQDGALMYTGGAQGYTDYPTLDGAGSR